VWEEAKNGKEWDDFVAQNGGSIYHSWSYRNVLDGKDSHGNNLKPYYLAYRDGGGRILAVCPFFYTKARKGRFIQEMRLESLPDHSSMGGPVISSQAMSNSSKILSSLPRSAKFSLLNPVVDMKIRIHQQPITQLMIALGFYHENTDGLFILDLHEKTPEHIWKNGFKKHDRQAVQFYNQRGAEFVFVDDEAGYVRFSTLKNGSGWHNNDTAAFLSKMKANLGDRLRIASVIFENKITAGNTILCDCPNSIVQLGMFRYSVLKNIHSPVTYVNWKTINWAYEHGFRYVNFGPYQVDRSSDPSDSFYKLKERFELTFVPRYKFYLPVPNTVLSIARKIRGIVA
jgi:hypothetical protein